MLVLTRKKDESIRIGNDVVITVLECEKGHTKIGISAPRSVSIYREEIYNKIQEENKASIISDVSETSLLKKVSKKK